MVLDFVTPLKELSAAEKGVSCSDKALRVREAIRSDLAADTCSSSTPLELELELELELAAKGKAGLGDLGTGEDERGDCGEEASRWGLLWLPGLSGLGVFG
jgi:hypothetical protein